MDIRTVTTQSSVWTFDLDRMMYVRLPKGEDPHRATAIAYTGEWEPFIEIVRQGWKLLIVRPVPWNTGQWRETGYVLTDTHSVLPYPENDPLPEPILETPEVVS